MNGGLIESFAHYLDELNKALWSNVLIFLLLGMGLFFTLYTNFVQVRLFGASVREMMGGRQDPNDPHGITPFQAFVTGLASRVGVGNIVGVAIAVTSARNIDLGITGAGAVFWMWITALIGMSSAFAESSLAQLFKIRDHQNNQFRGGPAYYITRGLGQKWLGVVFAVSLILVFGYTFNAVQANQIAGATESAWGWNRHLVGVGLVILTAPIIFGGMRRVSKIAEGIVPIMALCWLLITLYVVFKNASLIGDVLALIFHEAFDFRAMGSGFLGGMISVAMMNGVKHGLYSNEAGMGSAPNAAAAADVKHPASQGMIQMLGVFVDTIIICSCTAVIVLLAQDLDPKLEGIQVTQEALRQQIGAYGPDVLAVLLFIFAFSSVIGNYAYAESNVQFISDNPVLLLLFRMSVLVLVYFGSVQGLGLVIDMAGFTMGIMALINLIAIFLLRKYVRLMLTDYTNQRKRGKEPEFKLSEHPGLNRKIKSDIW